MQFQADLLGVPVVRAARSSRRPRWAPPTWPGVAVGLWTEDDTRAMWREARRYEPRMGEDERAALLAALAPRAGRARGWATPDG